MYTSICSRRSQINPRARSDVRQQQVLQTWLPFYRAMLIDLSHTVVTVRYATHKPYVRGVRCRDAVIADCLEG